MGAERPVFLFALAALCAACAAPIAGALDETHATEVVVALEQAGVALDPRGNVKATMDDYRTSAPKVFSCGDMRRGQSLVVWAIREGRQAARAVDQFLMGRSDLPR